MLKENEEKPKSSLNPILKTSAKNLKNETSPNLPTTTPNSSPKSINNLEEKKESKNQQTPENPLEQQNSTLNQNEYNNYMYQLSLQESSLNSSSSDSYSSDSDDDSIKTTSTITNLYKNNSFEEFPNRNTNRGEREKEPEKNLTGCALYLKHGLLFKKDFRCGEEGCQICSDSKFYYRRKAEDGSISITKYC